MSFSLQNLSVLAYSNGFTLWLYQGAFDEGSSIMSAEFFHDAGDMLAQGDIIMVSSRRGGLLLSVCSSGSSTYTFPMQRRQD